MTVFYIDILLYLFLEACKYGSVINYCLCITLTVTIINYQLFLHFKFYCDDDSNYFFKIQIQVQKFSNFFYCIC